MKKLIALFSLVACASAQSQLANDAERLRISNQRAALEAGFDREDADCYKNFLVSSCLGDVKSRRNEALADLRRQEISLNDQERKAKGAEQIRKTEDKESPEKQQQAADKRAEALKESDARLAREEQKNTNRTTAEAKEKSKLLEAASRIENAQDKLAGRAAKQAASANEVKKYKQRVEKAEQRQAKLAKEKASQTKPSAQPLPVPADN